MYVQSYVVDLLPSFIGGRGTPGPVGKMEYHGHEVSYLLGQLPVVYMIQVGWECADPLVELKK